MRKFIKAIGYLTGVVIAMFGFIVCMCETSDIDKQIVTTISGLLIFVIGVAIVALANRGEENELCT